MLEIVKGRPWYQAHTFVDDSSGTASDLTDHSLKCQIREKVAKKVDGQFVNALVVEPTVELQIGTENVVLMTLTLSQVNQLALGDYVIDLVGELSDNSVESLLEPEPIRVVNRPTQL